MIEPFEPERVRRLRGTLRGLIAELIPVGFLGAFTDDPADFALTERFCRELGRRGLLTIAWPEEYGGSGATVWESTALREEMWAAHEPRGPQYMGLNWVGPVMMRHGTEEQKRQHLPAIAHGEAVWCQGFSEPEAGSDLPALRTRAIKTDSGWRISGHKVWTSYAGLARWCFLLARTGPTSSGRAGITVFIVDLQTAGITVRPIRSMLGNHHLNEVFFDDVVVSNDSVLGTVDDGWRIVTDVIALERVGVARYARCERLLDAAPAAVADWDLLPAALLSRWAMARVHARQARLLAYAVIAQQESGVDDPAAVAAYRIASTTLDQEVAEVLMDAVGPWALGSEDPARVFEREVEDHWRYSQASTIASGTLEMQRQALGRALAAR